MPEPDTDLLRFVKESPLAFGSWRELKSLYKKLEADPDADPELLGALIGRLDSAPLSQHFEQPRVEIGRTQSISGIAPQGEKLAVVLNRSWNNPYLSLLDFSVLDKLKPKKVGIVKLENASGDLRQVFWCGPLVVLAYPNAIQILEPERETFKPLATLSVENFHVAAQFPYLYVIVKDALRIFDLRDIHGSGASLDMRGAKQVAVGEGFAVVLGEGAGFAWNRLPTPGGLKILDTSDPKKPVMVGELPLANAKTLALEGKMVFVSTCTHNNSQDLHRIDLGMLSAPTATGKLNLGYSYHELSLEIMHGLVYATDQYRMRLLDGRDTILKELSLTHHVQAQQLALSHEWLYASSWQGLSLLSLAYPERPTPYGTPPSAKTLGYMKRRARRHLQGLAETDPKRFVELAYRTLSNTTEPLEPTKNWVAYDLLFGSGKRFAQRSHGRGAFVEKSTVKLNLRRSEARGAAAWTAHPELAAKLYLTDNCLWQARELALKVLRAAKATVPDAKGTGVATPSLLLTAYGVRELVGAKKLTPELAALGFARAIARQRTQLLPNLLRHAEADPAWKATFVECLLRASDPSNLRRFGAIAGLVAECFPEAVSGTAVIRLVPGLLATGKANLTALALNAAQSVDEGTLDEWLELLPGVRESDREALISALEAGAAGKDLGEPYELVEHENVLVREALWRVLAASATAKESLRSLWDDLFLMSSENVGLQTAMNSPYALATLGRAGYTAAELSTTLTERPFLVGILDTQAFTSLTQTLPVTATLNLIAAADDAVWGRIRDGWVRNLREGLGITELWSALPEALKNDTAGNLENRVLNDPTITECLLTCEDATRLLEIRESALGPLLGRWLVRHWPKLESDEGLLLTAATHVLADVRTPALEIVARNPLRLPFALRLLECEIPGSVAVGKRWFEASVTDELEYRALALCDSPVYSVRTYGRQFATAKALTGEKLALALFEHDEPDMQAFAAEVAGGTAAPRFDRTVLRARHKSRRAKETVKTRQENAAPDAQVDVATLLALARGAGSSRDAEWALVQLTKRALAGETVEGLSV
ncbi:hypothetical protein [Armatimonas sp.]|uniref:hypothetical protein n=1 Tax=Armatimonas sp. TaxID=1872638 RepID=UPI00286C05A8|nr:hypothetical protein [Armatimonas sp.]